VRLGSEYDWKEYDLTCKIKRELGKQNSENLTRNFAVSSANIHFVEKVEV
jgi:hypothetical protein